MLVKKHYENQLDELQYTYPHSVAVCEPHEVSILLHYIVFLGFF